MVDCRMVERRSCVEAAAGMEDVDWESNASRSHHQKTLWAVIKPQCCDGDFVGERSRKSAS